MYSDIPGHDDKSPNLADFTFFMRAQVSSPALKPLRGRKRSAVGTRPCFVTAVVQSTVPGLLCETAPPCGRSQNTRVPCSSQAVETRRLVCLLLVHRI